MVSRRPFASLVLRFVGNLEIGQGTLASDGISRAVRHALSSPSLLRGVTIQNFNVLESRLGDGIDTEWVIYNVHLPAFDSGSLRRLQLVAVLRPSESPTRRKKVVAGGDWNMRLAPTTFTYTTAERHKSWVRTAAGCDPSGWHLAADAATPTNRTVEQPYRSGVNYTSVIDGFLVSPNVEVVSVETLDLVFAHSDHNPVRVKVRRREG